MLHASRLPGSTAALLVLILPLSAAFADETVAVALIKDAPRVSVVVNLVVVAGLGVPGEAPVDPGVLLSVGDGSGDGPVGLDAPVLYEREGRGEVVLEVAAEPGRVLVDGLSLVPPLRLTGQGPLGVGGRTYAGSLEVHRRDAGLTVVNRLPLESYVAGVLAGEVPASWPPAALRAQAVAARTYALFARFNAPRSALYDLESSVHSQVYKGLEASEDSPLSAATKYTRGQVLVFRRAPIHAFFHSCCGGHTEAAEEVWGAPLAYLPGVPCGTCADCPRAAWSHRLPLDQMAIALGFPGLQRVEVAAHTPTGRVKAVRLAGAGETREVTAVDFRRRLGYTTVPGNRFDVTAEQDAVVVNGKGSGHGVGLCQWGARGMAAAGRDYREILQHYYPGTSLKMAY